MEGTPLVDIETRKIYNCKEGTKEYEHEENHLKFADSPMGSTIQYFGQISIFYTILSLVVGQFVSFFKYASILGASIMLFCFIYEEIQCSNKTEEVKQKV